MWERQFWLDCPARFRIRGGCSEARASGHSRNHRTKKSRVRVILFVATAMYALGAGLLLAGGGAKLTGRNINVWNRALGGGEVVAGSVAILALWLDFPHKRTPALIVAVLYWGFFLFLLARQYGSRGPSTCDCFGRPTEIAPEHAIVVSGIALASTLVAFGVASDPARTLGQSFGLAIAITATIGGLLLMTLLELGRAAMSAWVRSVEGDTSTWTWHLGGGREDATTERV